MIRNRGTSRSARCPSRLWAAPARCRNWACNHLCRASKALQLLRFEADPGAKPWIRTRDGFPARCRQGRCQSLDRQGGAIAGGVLAEGPVGADRLVVVVVPIMVDPQPRHPREGQADGAAQLGHSSRASWLSSVLAGDSDDDLAASLRETYRALDPAQPPRRHWRSASATWKSA